MPGRSGTRPLKRWRYVGVFAPEVMVCVGEARIGPVPQRWWAVAWPDGRLAERTTVGRGGVRIEGSSVRVHARAAEIELDLDERAPVETATAAGDSYIWTAKQAAVHVRGRVRAQGREHSLEGPLAVVDDSAGYHPRHTAWRWSAGVGRTIDGRVAGWNLVTGVHDSLLDSERTVWLDGRPEEAEPVEFADDLSAVGALRFTEWAAREENLNLGLMRSRYRQPFGSFAGELPGGIGLAEGHGVMEEHDVLW
jgi:hypothetical protein